MPGQVLGEITQRYLQAAPRLLGLLALSGGAGGAEPKKEGSDERVATPQRQEVRRSAAPSRRLQPARRGAKSFARMSRWSRKKVVQGLVASDAENRPSPQH